MSRIVPAKPKIDDRLSKSVLLSLEKGLSDEFIVFQALPEENTLLVGGVGKPWVAIYTADEVKSFDPDSQELICAKGAVDPLRKAKELENELEGAGVQPLEVLFFISRAEAGEPIPEKMAGILCLESLPDLKDLLSSGKGSLDASSINGVIKSLQGGASEYVPGKITEAQAQWRSQSYNDPDPDGFVAETVVEVENLTVPKKIRKSDERVVLNKSSAQRVKRVEDLVRSCIANIQGERPIFSCGVEIDPDFIAGADALLPVILVAASDRWASIVSKESGYGGFDVRMARDPEALVGMRVIDVLASSPFLMFMPLAHVFKNSRRGAEFDANQLIGVFARWVEKYDLEDTDIEAIEVNVAIRAIDGA